MVIEALSIEIHKKFEMIRSENTNHFENFHVN